MKILITIDITKNKNVMKPDIRSFNGKSELPPANRSQMAALPKNWNPIDFEVDGKKVPCLYIPAKNPKVLLGFGAGFNPNKFKQRRILSTFYENGISVIATEFPRIDRHHKGSFIPRFQKESDAFFFDKNSPLFTVGDPNLPRSILAHSARGLTALKSMLDKRNFSFANKNFQNVYIMNPMLGVSGVTKNFVVRSFFNAYAEQYPKHLPHETPIGEWYMEWKKLAVVKDNPTLIQITEMRNAAKIYREKLEQIGGAELLNQFNFTFIIGEDDNATCPETSQDIAKILGAKIKLFKSDHTPLVSNKNAMKFFIEDLTQAPFKNISNIPVYNGEPTIYSASSFD